VQRIVIGTAGHVDHGKTLLTKALTNMDTDRLPAEKTRGITIELGFALWQISENLCADIIDVPGHEKFVRTMAAGVSAVDLVLLLVAADEGIMPQTKEHLDIISLLNIQKGVIVISKADKTDPAKIKSLKTEIGKLLAPTPLKNAPIVAVSALTGEGIQQLTQEVKKLAKNLPAQSHNNFTRLPIDRCFSVKGFGTVVTGTLWSGKLQTGDNIKIYPGGKTARIRRLEVNGKKVEKCIGKQRVALNLAGIEKADVPRGSWLSDFSLTPVHTVLAEVYLLPSAKTKANNSRVHIRFGTKEVNGRLKFTGESLKPQNTQTVKIHFEQNIFPLVGDRLILAEYSPVITIGSAKVLALNPPKKQSKKINLPNWENVQTLLKNYHQNNPLYPGISENEFKKKIFVKNNERESKEILKLWQTQQKIKQQNGYIALYSFEPYIDKKTQKTIDNILDVLNHTPLSPPAPENLAKEIINKTQRKIIFEYLLKKKQIVKIDNLIFSAEAIEKAEKIIVKYLQKHEKITLAETRNLLQNSRKFALPILEYLDQKNITKRQNDYRILNK
jgi:selenocysteine-specific elongation factor SelB